MVQKNSIGIVFIDIKLYIIQLSHIPNIQFYKVTFDRSRKHKYTMYIMYLGKKRYVHRRRIATFRNYRHIIRPSEFRLV